jgi:hypothetical protein
MKRGLSIGCAPLSFRTLAAVLAAPVRAVGSVVLRGVAVAREIELGIFRDGPVFTRFEPYVRF